jgi:hypothetical protein
MDNDDIQMSITAHRQLQWERSKAAWTWLQAHMPVECDTALTKFVAVNPQLRGIEWWDALDMLDDSDSHLDILEPIADAMEDDWGKTHEYVALTLLYASQKFAIEFDVEQRVQMVDNAIKGAR